MELAAQRYQINLVRDLRAKELKIERQNRIRVFLGLGCFGTLLLACIYSGMTIRAMEMVLAEEHRKLANIQSEYQKYTATRTIVDKGDVELLNSLQSQGIFWTKKLAALAKHLPENYTITSFAFRNGELRVSGYGDVSSKQEQLLTLDAYLNRLRKDSTFTDDFKTLYLGSAQRKQDKGEGKVAFEFFALTGKGAQSQ